MKGEINGKIANGPFASSGHYDNDAVQLASTIAARVAKEGIETVRIVFPDQHGILRGKTITARKLESIFSRGLGVPSTLLLKDTAHKTVFDVWAGTHTIDGLSLNGAGDLLMAPDPTTYTALPWSEHSALLICDVKHRSADDVSFSSRTVLKKAMAALAAYGYTATFGLEVEFQIFRRIDDGLQHSDATMPATPVRTTNLTQGWQYLTESRYGEAEEILDVLRRSAEAMGLAPCSMEIEMGPSQFEFTFDPSDPLQQADRFVLFRTMVKEICHKRGLHASFMAKPRLPNAAANGWHIHQSLISMNSGLNVFMPERAEQLTEPASHWIGGLLQHAKACCLLTTPTVNGYKRYAPFQLAPNRIQWGTDNRGAMIRTLLFPQDEASRIENRAPDTTANPYFAFAAQLLAGLDGLQNGTQAPAMTETPYGGAARESVAKEGVAREGDARMLPSNLNEAIEAFDASPLFRTYIGDEFVDYLVHIKRSEWQRYLKSVSEWEQTEYFNLF